MDDYQQICQFVVFRQISQVRTCKFFQFLEYHGVSDLSIEKALNQPYQSDSLLNMISSL